MRFALLSLALFCAAAPVHADVARGVYRGSSQTTVKFLNPVTLQVEATRRYSRKLTVSITKPLAFAGTKETNPFNFAVNPTVKGKGLVVADFFTASARTIAVAGRTTLLQYWAFENTQSGFTGTFVNSHPEAAQRDRIIAPLSDPDGALKPHRLYDGSFGPNFQTTASGLVQGKQMSLTLKGYARVGNQAIISFETLVTAKKR
jgi:hypothetical protein